MKWLVTAWTSHHRINRIGMEEVEASCKDDARIIALGRWGWLGKYVIIRRLNKVRRWKRNRPV